MLTYEHDSGDIVIDFPDGPVRVKPPRFGAMKRLRAERHRLAWESEDAIAAWETDHPEPALPALLEDGTTDVAATAEWSRVVTRRRSERDAFQETTQLDGSVRWWRLCLEGDDTFKGLAVDPVPADADDWPGDLLYDFRPVVRKPVAELTVEELEELQPTIDQVFRHWGKARSRSGRTNGQTAG